MTISLANSRIDYVGSGSTATYSFNFQINRDEDLLVTVRDVSNVETTLDLTADYTVSGSGQSTGGSITLLAGNLTLNYALTIRRVVDIIQTTDLRNQGAFFPESHEDEFDYLTMIDQQQQDLIDRSIKTAETDTVTGLTLPVASVRANKYFAFDGSGNAIAAASIDISNATVSSYMLTLLDDANASLARATLGFSGTGGTAAAAQLDSNSVTTVKITDANVTRAKLASGAVANAAITATKTTTYTASASGDDYIPCDASSAGFTVNLPAVASSSGKRFIIQKVDTSNNVVTVDGNAAETINGATTIKLSTQYEAAEIYCTGSIWLICSRDYPRTSIDGSSSFTLDNVGTTSLVSIFYQRLGNRMYVKGYGKFGTVAASTFSISLPSGLTIDTSKISSQTNGQLLGYLQKLNATSVSIPATTSGPYPVFFDGSTNSKVFACVAVGASAGQFTKVNASSAFANSDVVSFTFDIPVTNWE